MNVFQVFTPADTPTVTYVERVDRKLEGQLRGALRTPKMITSLSGPSKSGKTVLIKKVIDPDDLITVSGAAVKSAADLWARVLNWMDAPSQVSTTKDHTIGVKAEGKAQAKTSIIVASGQIEAGGGLEYKHGRSSEEVRERGGIDQVVREIGGSDFVLFIDDFHYMPKETQAEVARQLKEAAEAGVRVCTASVPHRSDDVVRSNPELRGRVQAIDFDYWTVDEVLEIARRGFDALHLVLPEANLSRLAQEAFGSPQLIQQICLQACLRSGIEESAAEPTHMTFTSDAIRSVLEQASTTTDFSSLLEALHNGPKVRGAPRNQFIFRDGSAGDVYRCILLGLQLDPPALSFSYDDIYQRTRAVCSEAAPAGSSVSQALEQLPQIADDLEPNSRLIEWSDDVLDIVDPYFLYFLRCSPKLKALARTPA